MPEGSGNVETSQLRSVLVMIASLPGRIDKTRAAMGHPECKCPVTARPWVCDELNLQYTSVNCHLPVHALLPVGHIPMSLLVSTAVSRSCSEHRFGPEQRTVGGAEAGLQSPRGAPARASGAGHRTALLAGARTVRLPRNAGAGPRRTSPIRPAGSADRWEYLGSYEIGIPRDGRH